MNYDIENFGVYGEEWEFKLVKLFIEDRDHFKNDMNLINPNSFSNNNIRTIVTILIDFVSEKGYIPSYELLSSIMVKYSINNIELEELRETLKLVKTCTNEGLEIIKEESLKFFKIKELTKFFNEGLTNIKKGVDITSQNLEEKLNKILRMGEHDIMWKGVLDDIENTLSPENIVHIPIGSPEIDSYLNGGLIKGNLIVIAASSGVGKTSIGTAIAESAATHKCYNNNNEGFKVMQIFFEDNHPAIQKKHIGSIVEIEAQNLTKKEYIEIALKKLEEYEHKELIKKNIKLGRFRNGELTVENLKHYIELEIKQGFKPDMIIVDYFECLKKPLKDRTQNEWKNETYCMRDLENLTKDFGCAIVVMTQSTKGAADGMLLTLDKISGSAGKYQVGHMVITLNRSQEDQENGRAELFIPKNREGRSGRAFKIILNNGMPKIIVDDFFDNVGKMKNTQVQHSMDMNNKYSGSTHQDLKNEILNSEVYKSLVVS